MNMTEFEKRMIKLQEDANKIQRERNEILQHAFDPAFEDIGSKSYLGLIESEINEIRFVLKDAFVVTEGYPSALEKIAMILGDR